MHRENPPLSQQNSFSQPKSRNVFFVFCRQLSIEGLQFQLVVFFIDNFFPASLRVPVRFTATPSGGFMGAVQWPMEHIQEIFCILFWDHYLLPLFSTAGAIPVITVLGVSNHHPSPCHPSSILIRSLSVHSNSVLTFPCNI